MQPEVDQLSIPCPVCGKKIPYDRGSDKPQDFVCSEGCRTTLKEVCGFRGKWEVAVERASDPAICVWCKAPLADKVRRLDALYCSGRCQRAGHRAGLMTDKLREIRLSAIQGRERRRRTRRLRRLPSWKGRISR